LVVHLSHQMYWLENSSGLYYDDNSNGAYTAGLSNGYNLQTGDLVNITITKFSHAGTVYLFTANVCTGTNSNATNLNPTQNGNCESFGVDGGADLGEIQIEGCSFVDNAVYNVQILRNSSGYFTLIKKNNVITCGWTEAVTGPTDNRWVGTAYILVVQMDF